MPKPTLPATSPADFQLYVGIDIAAKSFVAALYQPTLQDQPARPLTYQQGQEDQAGFDQFQAQLERTGFAPAQVLLALEATGHYHLALATHFEALGYHVAVLNPKAVANYFKSQLVRTKTDKNDARNLAKLAYERKPPRWTPPPQLYHELHQRLVQRHQLVETRTEVKNRRHALAANPKALPTLLKQLDDLIAYLDQQIKDLTNELQTLSEQKDQWATSISLLQTIPGIGLLTASLLVAVYRNFTNCPSPEAATQYAGLAPNERSSGTSVRGYQAVGGGGNSEVRRLLYMAALSAVREGAPLHEYYQRLITLEKKARKVALIAVARKLLHIAYAVVRKGEAFDAVLYQRRWQERQQPKTQAA